MVQLITLLSSGKGTWFQVKKVVESYSWEEVFVITDDFGKSKINFKAQTIVVDFNKGYDEIIKSIVEQLKGKLGWDVALNLSSGTGREHMAVLTAMFKLGSSIKFVDVENDKAILIGESDSIDDFFNS